MCLVVSVELLGVPKKEARLLTSERRLSDSIELRFGGMTRLFNRGNPLVFLSEIGEGCGCSMLTDNADWNAPTWDLREEVVGPLADKLVTIDREVANGFAFEALWVGDRPSIERRVTIGELVECVKTNQIGTKVRYVVLSGRN
jgi:hypothetical protein